MMKHATHVQMRYSVTMDLYVCSIKPSSITKRDSYFMINSILND